MSMLLPVLESPSSSSRTSVEPVSRPDLPLKEQHNKDASATPPKPVSDAVHAVGLPTFYLYLSVLITI